MLTDNRPNCLRRPVLKTRTTIFFSLLIAIIFSLVYLPFVLASDKGDQKKLPGQPDATIAIAVSHSHLLKTRVPIIRASVADPEVADVKMISPNQVLVIAKAEKPASTTLILWQNENRIKTFDVHIYKAISPVLLSHLRRRMHKIAPSIKIEILPAVSSKGKESILLTGEVPSQEILSRALNVVEAFDLKFFNLVNITGSQQVQLKVMIAEISRSGVKQMGINFLNTRMGIFKGGSSEGSNEQSFSTGSDTTQGYATEMAANQSMASPFASAFQIAMNSADNNWLGLLSLLKGQGLAKALATPTLVTMNGQTAKFQVGGNYPIPVQGEKGSITIEQVAYGIILSFTPYIIDHETITLEVAPEVSTPDFSLGVTAGGVTVPGLTTRVASTTLQLKDGQTFAMAGLLKEDSYVTINKIPFLGDIPYLGALFTSKETKQSDSELVIMVTPTIVRPLNKDEIPILPGQDTENKISDIDFFIKNKLDLPVKNQKTENEFKGNRGFSK